MKFKLKNTLAGAALASLTLVSCSKYLDVNTDPNNPTDVPPKTILPVTTMSMAFANSNELSKAAAHLMQYSAGISGTAYAYDKWNIGSMDNQWNGEVFGGSLNNINILIDKTNALSPAYAGIAKLQKAYVIAMATDLWGDIPYTQAGRGLEFPTPVFEAQQDIYLGNSSKGIQSLFNLVREGLADLTKTTALTPTTDDLVYGGTIAKWTRFGNSLLLKFALQVSNVAPDTTKSVINSVLSSSAPYIDAATYDYNVPYTTANPNAYYVQDFAGSITGTQMLSARFLSFMRTQNDTVRLAKYFTKPNGVFTAYDNGSPFAAPTPAGNRSVYGTFVVGTSGDVPVRLLSSYQVSFILAEAALRFGTAGDPNTLYQAGIKAAMKAAGLTDAEITTYFNDNPSIVTLSGTTADKLKQIITQKYISLVNNAYEAYNDFRRTGYPALTIPLTTEGDDPNTMPRRYPYVSSESNANPNQPNPRPLTNVKVWWAL
ncbi:SusD/RagB family nutrient-binding outer membrane lipoprotein [Filimonas effusa]|uniref:SusD/RagB family nutrient-binding outer membrane lipoprotein n=1 Tax=Filimonas effusa TaxID=2508721 RepID=A0A4Q1D4V0_9BACT|nr:SusD/RagB family nutrient-binding outer membrane lipoprotein [Filimonas effusa]RXK83485.1 SusD/RagB family nutrient-binding outer membrane lipoprotein [Filimonas effusa]